MTSNMSVEKQNHEQRSEPTMTTRTVAPAVDIQELPESYVVRLDLPGVDRNTIKAQVNNQTLAVTATAPAHFKADARLFLDDSIATEYRREFALADNVDAASTDAMYENGVLTVTLKKKQQYLPRTIAIT